MSCHDHTCAKRLGQHQYRIIPGRRDVRGTFAPAGHRIADSQHFALSGMTAHKLCAGLAQRHEPAGHQLRELRLLQVHTRRSEGDSSHGPDRYRIGSVDITHRMNGGDPAKLERVGYDFRNHIDRLHHLTGFRHRKNG